MAGSVKQPSLPTALRIWDISPPVDEHSAVFPGDTAYSQRRHFSIAPGSPVNVNSLTLSPHTGAHADAPLHNAHGAASAGELDLTPYLGPCRVIDCLDFGPLVLPAHIAVRAIRRELPLTPTPTLSPKGRGSRTPADPAP